MALAARVGRVAAAFDAAHDRDATFVTEAYDEMHACGYLRLPVPTELGGLGASMRQVVLAEEELGRHSGAAALAAAMHLYLTLVQCWRWRRGAPDAEGVLRKVADDRLVLATSGGSDWVCPTTTAVEVPGGYRLDGRKQFCTQAPVAGVISTSATLGEPGPGRRRAARRRAAVGAGGLDRRDLGHAGHARHRQPRRGVRRRVPARGEGGRAAAVRRARRPAAGRGDPLRAGGGRRLPRRGARGAATRRCGWRAAAASPRRRRCARSARCGPGCRWRAGRCSAPSPTIGDDPALDEATLATVMTAKRHAVAEARAVVDLALEVAGGAAFYRRSPLERAYRDVRGGPFHPLTPEATLTLLGDAGAASVSTGAGA